jgi:hypothetical protein
VVFEQRVELMQATDVSETVTDMRRESSRTSSPSTSRKRPMPSSGTSRA